MLVDLEIFGKVENPQVFKSCLAHSFQALSNLEKTNAKKTSHEPKKCEFLQVGDKLKSGKIGERFGGNKHFLKPMLKNSTHTQKNTNTTKTVTGLSNPYPPIKALAKTRRKTVAAWPARLVGSSLAAHKKSFLIFRWINNHHEAQPQPPRSPQTLELKAGLCAHTAFKKSQELSRVYGFGGSRAISSCYARDVDFFDIIVVEEKILPRASWTGGRLAAWRIGLGFSDLRSHWRQGD